MMKKALVTPLAVALLLLVLPAPSTGGDPLFTAFQDPPSRFRPFVRWWWNGGCVTEAELLRQLDLIGDAGIGGVEINTIAMPDSAVPESLEGVRCLEWLSPEWNRIVRATTEGARERDLTADLIVGSGRPFGGRFLEGAERTQRVRVVKLPLAPFGTFEARIGELAALKERRRDEVEVEPHLVFLRAVPRRPTSFEPGIDLRSAVSADGMIRFPVPPGEYFLYAGILEEGSTVVKLGAPGADGPALNHFDAAAVRRYLDRMSESLGPALGGRLGDALRATFVDNLELDFANWTDDLPAEFERRRGYDLMPYLPFVLDVGGEGDGTPFADTVRRARYDFHRTVVELFQERFLATYAEWCRDNGLLSRVQAYGRETHPVDGGLLIDIPVFRATLADMKLLLDMSVLTGVLHPIIHGFSYSPREAGFPGWVRLGTWLNEQNPWWPHLRRLTDYSARLTTVLAQSDGQADLAILGPRADEWARHVRLHQPFPEVAVPWYLYELPAALASAGYGSDFVSENVLQESTAEGGTLRFGPRTWKALLVLDAESLEPETARAIERFARTGGTVLFVGRAPDRSPGLHEAESRDRAVREAIEAARAAGSERVAVVPAPEPGPLGELDQTRVPLPDFARRQLLHWVGATLPAFALEPPIRIDAPHIDVAQLRHRVDEREIVFFANTSSSETVAFRARVASRLARPWRWDPETGLRAPYPVEEGTAALWIRLEPSESLLLVFGPPGSSPPDPDPVPLRSSLPPTEWMTIAGEWAVSFQHAVEDLSFERTLHPLEDLSLSPDPELASFAGTLAYRTAFDVAGRPFDRLDLGEVNGVSEVRLNGQPLGVRWWGRHTYDVAGVLKPGSNTLEVEVTTVVANYAHSLKDNPAAQRWASWYPPISTGLVGPVRLLKTRQ